MSAITRKALQAMHARKQPSQGMHVRFACTVAGTNAFAQLVHDPSIQFCRAADGMWAMAVAEYGIWDGPQHSIHLYPGQAFLNSSFQWYAVDCRGVESITCDAVSPLNAIQSGRILKRDEVYGRIMSSCISDGFRRKVADWGCSIQTRLDDSDGLYGVEICLCDSFGNPVWTFFLDGWSGNVSADGVWEFFFSKDTGAGRVSRLLEDRFQHYLEAP